MLSKSLTEFAPQSTNYYTHTSACQSKRRTFGKFTSKAAIIAIVDEQTNAAELDSPEPAKKKYCSFPFNLLPSTDKLSSLIENQI